MTQELIKLIVANKSLSEICEITKLSRKQLFIKLSMLRQSGYLIDKEYNYNGEINYLLQNPFNNKSDDLTIKAPIDLQSIRMILTSDSHYGHINENLECTDKMFDYCTKENINLIFHLGDFFEGVLPNGYKTQKYTSIQEQIQGALTNYPCVPNILTFACLGNHDASYWIDAGIDIKTILENRRHDIIPVGYKQGIVKINDYRFILKHPIERTNIKIESENQGIMLYGHSHKFHLTCKASGNHLKINVPSSSNIASYGNAYTNVGIPSIIDAEFILNQNTSKITQGIFKQYILINNQLVLISEQVLHLNIMAEEKTISEENTRKPSLQTCFDKIEALKKEKTALTEAIVEETNEIKNDSLLEEQTSNAPCETPKSKVLTKSHKDYNSMSQIEKFNMRYNQ